MYEKLSLHASRDKKLLKNHNERRELSIQLVQVSSRLCVVYRRHANKPTDLFKDYPEMHRRAGVYIQVHAITRYTA